MAPMKLLYMMGNVTCVLRETKMLTADNEVDYDSIKAKIAAMPLPEEQIEDLQRGLEDCKHFSSCIGEHQSRKSPVMAKLGPQMAFFKCFKVRMYIQDTLLCTLILRHL